MQCFGGQGQAQVVVDYAHTPDALEKALQSLRPFCSGRLFCVFGCGGERDVGKRPLMAATAERWADCLILTDDNPRGEDPGQIIRDMLKGLLADDHVAVVHQRDQAIKQAIAQASSGDVVLVAGKGHETEQIIGSDVWLSDDREWVQQALAEKEKIGK
jgi:UDP-N-acetylmuramoyl-L-alanyl-D-glutamate--2,6-diaminopimelate ligase